MAAALMLKKEDEPAPTRCPSCGAALVEGAVICVQCGYDFRSGRRVDEEVAPRRNPLMLAGVALLVAVAAGLVGWRMLSMETPPMPPPVTESAPAPVAPAAPAPVAEPIAQVTNAAPEVASAPSLAPDATAVATGAVVEATGETNAPPAVPALDPVVVEAEQREVVVTQLDQMAPLYEVGEVLELRLANGLVQRGQFASRAEEHLVLTVASNETRTVEFTLLDRGSRVRSDPQFRARYIDHHVQQRVQKILQQQAPAEASQP